MKKFLLLTLFALAVQIFPSLAQSVATTPQAALSQQKVVDRFPEIGMPGTALNAAFVEVFNHWKIWKPQVLQRDDWPELVAIEAIAMWRAQRDEEERSMRQVIQIKR